jgi:hypothetical protein
VTNAEYVQRVLRAWERCDLYDELLWRVKDDGVRFFAMCSDVFYWGTADCEEIADDDVTLLEATADDLLALDATFELPVLFCARKRGMRPQTPWGRSKDLDLRYTHDNLSPAVRALFDACGPVRDPKDEG